MPVAVFSRVSKRVELRNGSLTPLAAECSCDRQDRSVLTRWRSGLQLATTINCTTSSRLGSGTPSLWRQNPLVQADKLVGGSDAVLVIDDTAIPKKGVHSVGVAARYALALGKTANCQTLVSLTLARGEVPVMLALRLFLPESWTGDRRGWVERVSRPVSNGTNEAGVGSSGDRLRHRGSCALWQRLRGFRLWAERAAPPGAHSSQTGLGSWYSAAPQGYLSTCR